MEFFTHEKLSPRVTRIRDTAGTCMYLAEGAARAALLDTGVGLGDVMSVRAHLWQMNRARVVVATTDNTGLPAARLKARGALRAPLIYISVGLPEHNHALL